MDSLSSPAPSELQLVESELPESESLEADALETESSDFASTVVTCLEPSLLHYFQTFNAGEFDSTAALFATEGVLYPPFESSIVGPEAIAAYLTKEAKGMKAMPYEVHAEAPDEKSEANRVEADKVEVGERKIKVVGKVQTPFFSVNVSWHFVLNSQSEILAVRLRLLAALEELLKFKR